MSMWFHMSDFWICHPFIVSQTVVVSYRNYNPVERRSKGGKERSVKGTNKMPKSLQTNNTHPPPNSSLVGLNKASGLSEKIRLFIQTKISLIYFLSEHLWNHHSQGPSQQKHLT